MAVIKITNKNFENEVLNSDKPVLIDFWASWCAPCRMVAPVLEEISGEVTDVKIGKVNIDEENDLAIKYKVMSIPTLILFKNGKAEKTMVGAKPKDAIIDFIK